MRQNPDDGGERQPIKRDPETKTKLKEDPTRVREQSGPLGEDSMSFHQSPVSTPGRQHCMETVTLAPPQSGILGLSLSSD